MRLSGLPASPAENETIVVVAKALVENVKVHDEWLERTLRARRLGRSSGGFAD